MRIVTGIEVGKEICELLHLDPDLVSGISVHMHPGEVLYFEVTMFAAEGTADFIGQLIKRYVLVEQVNSDDPRLDGAQDVPLVEYDYGDESGVPI